MKLRCWPLILCMVILFFVQTPGHTEVLSPRAALQGPIDEIIKVLNDPGYKTPDQRADQRNKIWQIANPMFDFTEISRRSVGKPWKKFSEQEKIRFTEVFSKFFGATYIDKLQGEYNNEKIDIGKELIKGNRALVQTKLLRESTAVALDFRLKQSGGQWKIYDVLVENGVSLVKNYRVQFASALQKESPAQLIEKLEKRLAEQQPLSGKSQ
ncbi:MAG: ABC transporter substrate-binding protein [Desulfobacteraceae bacterium]